MFAHTCAGGSKLSLAALRALLEAQRVDWSVLWEKIIEVVLACLFVVQVRMTCACCQHLECIKAISKMSSI